MNHLNIKIPVFNDRCHILWPYSKPEADAWLRSRKFVEEAIESKDCVGFTCYSNRKNNGAAIFLKSWTGSVKDIGVLVHEAVHAASFIRSNVGVDETNESLEVLCYLSDYITQKALTRMGTANNKPKTKQP